MKASDFLVQEIYNLTRTDKFFGYIGGTIAHIVDSIYKNKNVELINTISEQGAGFAAEGYSRTTGRVGVTVATSGPGATNLVTPIANCFYDSSPVIFVTGQVNSYEYRKYDIKQCGFQETNIVDIVKPITKYSVLITGIDDLKYELHKAIYIALTGRKGPCLLDIPMDIQRAEIVTERNLRNFIVPKKKETSLPNFDVNIIKRAHKPLILVGNGVHLSGAKSQLRNFLNKTGIPVIETLLGIDLIETNYKYNLGMIGVYGNRYGNIALYDCDLLMVLGARLDIRQTGSNVEFMKNKSIIHVDIDKHELNCPKFEKIKIYSDLKDFMKYLNHFKWNMNISLWQEKVLKLKSVFPEEKKHYKLPTMILSKIFSLLKPNDVIISDVGQNQVWTGQGAQIISNQRLFSSAGHGCMGFSLLAAIGATFSKRRAIVIAGDGGIQMNIQELEVIKRRNLPVKIIILNNNSLGMVRVFQSLYFNKLYASTIEDYSAPNFTKIANAYGIKAIKIKAKKFNIDIIKVLLEEDFPVLIEIVFDQKTQVEPRVQFGNSIENAHPLIDEKILKELLK